MEIVVKGHTVIYDDADHHRIAGMKVYIRGQDYKYAHVSIGGKIVLLHRLFTDAPKGMLVDHINHNTLDNRQENLRLCTRSQNMWNRKRACGVSKYKGVVRYQHRARGLWGAAIVLNNQRMHLGTFEKEEDAALAYNMKALELFGEYACLNEVEINSEYK